MVAIFPSNFPFSVCGCAVRVVSYYIIAPVDRQENRPDPNSTLVQKKENTCSTQYRTRTRIDARGVPQRGSKDR
ncbi:hypothetical protein PspLS_11047 [Pyricularia sp. CBS 133598]|nr:hypothetical protein PspLS_11047 [Pyricularia sp. CBS 133598]